MLDKLIVTTLSVISLSVYGAVHAENMDNCKVQIAVSTPPIQLDQSVAFNVSNEAGINKSVTLKGGSAPQFIDKLPCSNVPFTISATVYSTPSNDAWMQSPPVGQCTLNAGAILLNGSGNSVSVVFPYDFTCTN